MGHASQFATRDPEEALPVLGQFFPEVRMSNPEGGFAFDLATASTPKLSVLDYRLLSPNSSSSVNMNGELAIGRLRRGGLSLRDSRGHIDTTRPWLFPQEDVNARWDGVDIRVLILSKDDVARLAHATVGASAFRFEFTGSAPLDELRSRRWLAAMEAVTDEVLSCDFATMSPVAHASALSQVMSLLLATFPNTMLEIERSSDHAGILPAAIRRALDFIEVNAELPITNLEIAEAARLSVRGLQYAFRDHLGSTPTARLRQVRLARVHEALQLADPADGTTVASIALQWGFAHLGRFADLYRRTYGQSPALTLRGA